jgi:hypothetical protein
MMSSENPLTTTTRHYQNNYEAKKGTSLANNDRVDKDYYLKSGVSSKDNPLAASTTADYYQGFTGKKVEERVDAPQAK